MPFAVTPVNNTDFTKNIPGPSDGLVTITGGTTSTGTTTTVTSNVATVAYGTAVTLTATVVPASGTATPTAGSVDFKDGTVDLGVVSTETAGPNNTAIFTLTTSAKQLQVLGTTPQTITATYTPPTGSTFTGSNGTLAGGIKVTARSITVSAAANTKGYDGSTSATATPTITGGTLVSGDTTAFTETYDNKNAGTGKTLTATGSVNDGNGGKDYTVTFAPSTAGVINTQALTVTATPITKIYDGTTQRRRHPDHHRRHAGVRRH